MSWAPSAGPGKLSKGGIWRIALIGWVFVALGCDTPEAQFEPNHLFVAAQQRDAFELPARQKDSIADVLTHWFGTPDEPRLPPVEEVKGLLDLKQLRMAAGPISSDEQGVAHGLFRKHCSACHGITGNGIGPVASFLDPYPRDFRRGVFKFKSTSAYQRPTQEDLKRIVTDGIPGTAMPSFALLPEEHVEALGQYVTYLALRGEVERALVRELFDRDVGEHDGEDLLADLSCLESDPRKVASQLEEILPLVSRRVEPWREANGRVTLVPTRPADWDMLESVVAGRELYYGGIANCHACHGELAEGDGQTTEYDEWTKEVVDPRNQSQVDQFLAAGGLPPRPIRPRNLRHAAFRGGDRPEDLYRRIHDGIRGMPMPPALMRPDDAAPDDRRLTTDDLWHLVDYIKNLPNESLREKFLASREKRSSNRD